MGYLVIQTSQISYESLGVILFQITFQEELLELPSVFFYTL